MVGAANLTSVTTAASDGAEIEVGMEVAAVPERNDVEVVQAAATESH